MSEDEAGPWPTTGICAKVGMNEKVNGGGRSCFPSVFVSDADRGRWIADGNGFPFMRPAILYKQWLFEGVKWQVLHLCRFTASFEMFPKCIWNGRSKLGTGIEPGDRVYSGESEYYALFFHLFILRFGFFFFLFHKIAVDMGNWVLRFEGVDIFEQTPWWLWLGVTG